jgi:Subtilase family.
VVPVYQELNITGRGVNIIVLDDGIDYGHEDLAASFVSIPATLANKRVSHVMAERPII